MEGSNGRSGPTATSGTQRLTDYPPATKLAAGQKITILGFNEKFSPKYGPFVLIAAKDGVTYITSSKVVLGQLNKMVTKFPQDVEVQGIQAKTSGHTYLSLVPLQAELGTAP